MHYIGSDYGRGITNEQRIENSRICCHCPTLHPLFSLPSREQLIQTLGTDGKAALINEADEIIGGKFRMFGSEPVPLQLTFNEPLHHWTDYETGKVPIPYSQFPIHDIKFFWEPARFGWAFVLGRAYHITQDEKYAEAFWKYFETFTDGNPPYLGPHWMNGQEVAIRLMSSGLGCTLFFKRRPLQARKDAIASRSIHCASRRAHSSNADLCTFAKQQSSRY